MTSASEERLTPKKPGLTGMLVLSIFGAIWGAFEFGFNTGVINAPEKVITVFLNETQYARTGAPFTQSQITIVWSIVVSAFAVGGMFGGVSAGWWGDRFGRKKAMLICNVFCITAALLMGLSKKAGSFEMLIIGRLIIGFGSGIYTGLTPLYLTEVAPVKLRGALGTVNQLGVTIALLVSQVLGIENVLGTATGWPILLGLAGVPCLIQLIVLPFCPESPRYLIITRGLDDEGRQALVKLRGSLDVQEEVDEMKKEAEIQRSEPKVSVLSLFKSSALRTPLVISIVMHLSQQLSGINAVFYYSQSIFESAGLSPTNAGYATIGVGCIMVVMTIVSIPLMDRAGRRTLHLTGLSGMFIFSIVMTLMLALKGYVEWFKIASVVAALCYVVFFALGPGSIPWMIVAELFSQGPRAAAISIGVLVNWLSNFIVGLSFKPLKEDVLHDYCFIPFSVLLLIFGVFIYFKLPETKNRTIEEITDLFRKNSRRASSRSSSGVMPVSYKSKSSDNIQEEQVKIQEPDDELYQFQESGEQNK
ncbi:solute carrier family 2, facilitated glucose transporter member 1-like [Tubulanus polymorphus]|uniref:solute carrier family 2, facilitated glucose transporter member 1-like n=1 Tax=Tubulanus polymorphus TaxID=672921 RepID=UPI003DA27F18